MDTCSAKTKMLPNGFRVRCDNDAVVSHDVLSNIPFERSIEHWVRTYFPEALFTTSHDKERVDARDLNLVTPGIFVLQAPKGTGKSKAIREAVRTQLSPKTTVVQITFRRSLAWSSSTAKGESSALYSSIADGISARQHPRLTIVVNSISRIRGTYDVVVIDELVSVLDMLSSSLLSSSSRVQAASTLCRLIGSAKTVIVADAMLDATCVDFVLLCKQMAFAESMPRKYWPSATNDLTFIEYTKRIHDDYSYVPHAKLSSWTEALENAIRSGLRVVVPCMTKVQAENLANKFKSNYVVQLYTGDMDASILQTHMKDIHTFWRQAAVLIYSPVITAGCSFELNHFDVVFFYGCAKLGSVRSAIQMIARVRDVSTKTVHVYISKADTYEPLPAEVLYRDPVYNMVTDYSDGYMKALSLLEYHRKMETLCAEASFPYYFWSLVVHSGAKIVFPAANDTPPVLKELEVAPKTNDIDNTEITTSNVLSSCTTSPATISCSTPSSQEYWWLHDWDKEADVHALEYDITGGIASSGTILERVSKLQPNHLLDLEYFPPTPFQVIPQLTHVAPENAIFPTWMSLHGNADRCRIWVKLIMRRAATLAASTGMQVAPDWRKTKFMASSLPLPSRVILHPPACSKSKYLKHDYEPYKRYINASLSWLDIIPDAWELAGFELSLMRNSQPSLPPPPFQTPCILECMEIASRINNIVNRYKGLVLHVNCQVNEDVAYSSRFHASAALVDFIIEDTNGDEHILQCRVQGNVLTHGNQDLCKLKALAVVLGPRTRSVGMFYLSANEFVKEQISVDMSPTTQLVSLSMSSTCYVRCWNVLQHVVFAFWDGGTDIVVYDPSLKLLTSIPTTGDSTRHFHDMYTTTKRIVSWGLATLCPQTRRAVDLEEYVRSRLYVRHDVRVLDIVQANVTSSSAYAKCGHDAMDHLQMVYLGICKKRYFVYFWNGKPNGLYVPSL